MEVSGRAADMQPLAEAPDRPELAKPERRQGMVTDDLTKAQARHFVWRTSVKGPRITKDSAVRAVERMRLASDP